MTMELCSKPTALQSRIGDRTVLDLFLQERWYVEAFSRNCSLLVRHFEVWSGLTGRHLSYTFDDVQGQYSFSGISVDTMKEVLQYSRGGD